MGQTYSIEMVLKYEGKDRFKVHNALKDFIFCKQAEGAGFAVKLVASSSFTDALEALFTPSMDYLSAGAGNALVRSCFDASYGWDDVMMEAMEAIAPFLADSSCLSIFPDHGYIKGIVEDGQLTVREQSDDPYPYITNASELVDQLEDGCPVYNTRTCDLMMLHGQDSVLRYMLDISVVRLGAQKAVDDDFSWREFLQEYEPQTCSFEDAEDALDDIFEDTDAFDEWICINSNTIDFLPAV